MIEVDLQDGIEVSGVRHTHAVLRPATVADLMDAAAASERPYVGADGTATLAASPTLMGIEALRRQVKKLGDLDGPIPLELMRRLTLGDLAILQAAAATLDAADLAAMGALARRGRADGPAAGAA